MKKVNVSMLRDIVILLAVLCVTMLGASTLFADADTTLMIHSDDVEGSYVITDSSSSAVRISGAGYYTKHTTSTSVFGASSIVADPLMNRNGGLITLDPVLLDDGTVQDITVDFWFKQKLLTNHWSEIYSIMDSQWNSRFRISWQYQNPSTVRVTAIIGGGNIFVGMTPDANAWNHIAFVRSDGLLKGYLNGILKNSAAATSSLGGSKTLGLFKDKDGTDIGRGYFDEIRISSGIARWTENFTPHASCEAFENIVAGTDSLGKGYSAAEQEQLYQLYEDGKNDLTPQNITINGTEWQYYDGELPGQAGHSIGEAYTYDGKQYIYLGSGLEGSGGGVPELPAGMMPFMGVAISAVIRRIRRNLGTCLKGTHLK